VPGMSMLRWADAGEAVVMTLSACIDAGSQ
jgi:hypothetical protein